MPTFAEVNLRGVHKQRRQQEWGKGAKIGQKCRRIVLKNFLHGRGDVKNLEKMPTSFMDGS